MKDCHTSFENLRRDAAEAAQIHDLAGAKYCRRYRTYYGVAFIPATLGGFRRVPACVTARLGPFFVPPRRSSPGA